MATIRKKVLTEKTRFEAIIRRQSSGQEQHRESRTFDTRQESRHWAKRREDALKNPAARSRQIEPGAPTLADLIEWYSGTFRPLNPWSRAKQSQLKCRYVPAANLMTVKKIRAFRVWLASAHE